MEIKQYFYTVDKDFIDDIRSIYHEGHKLTTEFVIDHLFDDKEDVYSEWCNTAFDTLLLCHCQRLVEISYCVYVVPYEVIRHLSRKTKFNGMSKEETERIHYTLNQLMSIYKDLDKDSILLYQRTY